MKRRSGTKCIVVHVPRFADQTTENEATHSVEVNVSMDCAISRSNNERIRE